MKLGYYEANLIVLFNCVKAIHFLLHLIHDGVDCRLRVFLQSKALLL